MIFDGAREDMTAAQRPHRPYLRALVGTLIIAAAAWAALVVLP